MSDPYILTAESVTEGHPDKIADQIADAILDEVLTEDAEARVAVEVVVSTGLTLVTGEITTGSYVEIPRIVRQVIADIGYTQAEYGFDAETCAVLTAIDEQSPDIAQGINHANLLQIGAGDQGMMYGFASNETTDLMPLPVSLAHALTWRLAQIRQQGVLSYLRPDGKAQVSVAFQDGKPAYIENVVLSAQHHPDIGLAQLRDDLTEQVIRQVLPADLLTERTRMFINPTGRFVMGGPQADTGLTGRKIMVDTYGSIGRHGGGSFSGKDPTKVDRSAAYGARYAAKNIVRAGLAERCEIEVAYAIGRARPVSIHIDTFGTERVPLPDLEKAVPEVFDLRPGAIIKALDLCRPIYRSTSVYGHFGRFSRDLPWEQTDRTGDLLQALPEL